MTIHQPLIDRTVEKAKTAGLKAADAAPGGALGSIIHGRAGVAIGALLSVVVWPSVKAFLINVVEWVLRGIQLRLRIPFVAPSPYPPPHPLPSPAANEDAAVASLGPSSQLAPEASIAKIATTT